MANVGRLVKDRMVEELTTAVKERADFFVAAVGPLPASEADALRKRLRGVKARLLIVKRTLGLRSLASLKLNGDTGTLFAGSVGVVLPREDLVQTAKLLVEFANANEGKLVIRGGWVEGQLLDQKRVQELASLPPKPQLIAQLIGVLESPVTDLIFTVERVLGDVAWVLEEASKTKPASVVAAAPSETVVPPEPPANPTITTEAPAPTEEKTQEPPQGGGPHA